MIKLKKSSQAKIYANMETLKIKKKIRFKMIFLIKVHYKIKLENQLNKEQI
jgi:hypothetical protein